MPTSKAGTSTRKNHKSAGFTLLEIMVVIAILSLTALMVFPKISAFDVNRGKRTTRHMARLIQYVAQESLSTGETFRLYYDLNSQSYWVKILQGREFFPFTDPLVKKATLPKGLDFEDVVTARHGKVREGVAYTEFISIGVEKTTIHLKDGEDQWSLIVNGLTGRVKIVDRYVDEIRTSTRWP